MVDTIGVSEIVDEASVVIDFSGDAVLVVCTLMVPIDDTVIVAAAAADGVRVVESETETVEQTVFVLDAVELAVADEKADAEREFVAVGVAGGQAAKAGAMTDALVEHDIERIWWPASPRVDEYSGKKMVPSLGRTAGMRGD